MTNTQTKRAIENFYSVRSPGILQRGWHLDSAGPARFGWAWRHASGRVTFLGQTLWLAALNVA